MPRARTVATTAVLAAIQVALTVTGRGTIPTPIGLNVTILSTPSIVAGVLAGPIPGAVVGAAFGVLSLALATTPLFHDPIIAVLPRLLIGPVAAGVYRLLRSTNESLALLAAGAAGAATNTALVIGLGTVLTGPVGAPYLAPAAAWDIIRRSLPPEAAIAAVIVLIVGHGARRLTGRR